MYLVYSTENGAVEYFSDINQTKDFVADCLVSEIGVPKDAEKLSIKELLKKYTKDLLEYLDVEDKANELFEEDIKDFFEEDALSNLYIEEYGDFRYEL